MDRSHVNIYFLGEQGCSHYIMKRNKPQKTQRKELKIKKNREGRLWYLERYSIEC